MPLTPLRQVLNQQRSGFTQQVQQLQGFAQSIRQSQARKQQMLEKVASEKEIIQFRSDVQLDQKKQFYEDVTRPQQQAEAQAEQMQQMQEQFNQSKEDAQKSIKNWQEQIGEAQHSSIVDYNLDRFNFGYDTVEQDGQLMGVQPEVYYANEKVPKSEFPDMLRGLSSFADTLKSVEESDEELVTKKAEDGTLILGNDDEGKRRMRKIRQDPNEAWKYYQMKEMGRLEPATGSPDSGEATTQSTLAKVTPKVIDIRDSLTKKGEKPYAFSDQDITDDWSFLGIGEDTENRKFTVNFNTSFSSVQSQMNEVAEMALDLPKDKRFNIGSLSDEEQQMIITGNVTDEKLSNTPSERANYIRKLANLNEGSRQELHKLFKDYNTYNKLWNKAVGETGLTYSKDNYVLDINNVPDDISQVSEFKKLFKHIEDWQNAGKLIDQGAKYWRDVQPTNQLVE